MSDYLLLLLTTSLVNNVVLAQFLGLCPFMGVSNKVGSAFGMGLATTFVLTLSCAAGWILDHYLLVPLELGFLRLLSFILVIAVLVQLTEMMVAYQSPELHRILGIFLPLITTNCAVLGIALLTIREKLDFVDALLYGFGSSLGFTLVIVLFAGLRERMTLCRIPTAMQGAPISFITAGILAMAFSGFTGIA
ncbi:electron transport complex subunit RsxA [Psychromonas antarctica]|jgi:electron transport complex protein RnfA|uniref:electron transport complex subunit RsxA n=1 Tax=Psychromonas antarctica TaxID=67573 RepID=UPI001EE84985|nr:electron transport complex subunit RsxA [Psychromonas antarctica]MCG6200818.1 electron transport complex subunit RsxA [Psychromonas antarctica]